METFFVEYNNLPSMNDVIDFPAMTRDIDELKQGPQYSFDPEILMHIPELFQVLEFLMEKYAPMLLVMLTGNHLAVQGTTQGVLVTGFYFFFLAALFVGFFITNGSYSVAHSVFWCWFKMVDIKCKSDRTYVAPEAATATAAA